MVITLLDKVDYSFSADSLAVECYRENPKAYCEFGLRLLEGNSVEASEDAGMAFLRRSAVLGNTEAVAFLEALNFKATHPKPQAMEAKRMIAALSNAAEAGATWAITELAFCYLNGIGTDTDNARATELLQEGALAGSVACAYELGVLFDLSRGSKSNRAMAFKWFKSAAEKGDSDAQFNLAMLYRRSADGLSQIREAADWLQKSAMSGNGRAMYELGLLYESGVGVTKSEKKSVHWYRRAAAKGVAKAQLNYGVHLHNFGTRRSDSKRARELYAWGAIQGEPGACRYFSEYLADGVGGFKDVDAAKFWKTQGRRFLSGILQTEDGLGAFTSTGQCT